MLLQHDRAAESRRENRRAHYRKLHPWPGAGEILGHAGRSPACKPTTPNLAGSRWPSASTFTKPSRNTRTKGRPAPGFAFYPIAWVSDEHPADWFWHKLPARAKQFNFWIIGLCQSTGAWIPHRQNGAGTDSAASFHPPGKSKRPRRVCMETRSSTRRFRRRSRCCRRNE